MPRPKSDLAALAVPKEDATLPATPPGIAEPKAYAHTLSLRLTAEQYRRLRRYVAQVEERQGRRLTHQALIEAALGEYLDRNGG
ncbi:conserved protein of unknown function (plasmid) [Rhodovastum atsumiense]|uniref:Uncharacterized protein n=1 Tax=Rhodovastum atsumiense TaxID=504468 RepID=A0A5M6IIP2_9PROT|nr:hypothetical protein [Rhodovastum atsumiense]KAA5608074.1 hypothetical protein F1189_30755 [Rhodovastum atsumiense]CAH2606526.1 conserved protein of unknown function [Rhodovastum atsumiense]